MINGEIILMCGLSGSGKSTWISNTLGDEPSGHMMVVLCPDEFRQVITGHEFYRPAEEFVWGAVKTAARVLVGHQKMKVVIDSTNLTINNRGQWIAIARELDVPIKCVQFNTPLEECLQRNAARQRKVPEDVLLRQAEIFVPPTLSEGFAAIEVVDESEKRQHGTRAVCQGDSTTPSA